MRTKVALIGFACNNGLLALRDKNAYRNAAWDWSILDGCFGRSRVSVADIDGMIERNGKFLFIEAKPLDTELPTGQRIALEALSQLPGVTVLVLYGKRNKPQRITCMRLGDKGKWAKVDYKSNIVHLRRTIRAWWRWANQRQS